MNELLNPAPARGVQQMECSGEVCIDDRLGREDAAVNMRLRREVNNYVGRVACHSLIYGGYVTEIRFDEPVTGVVRDRFQVFEIAGVRQCIEVQHFGRRVAAQHKPNKRGANETGSACHEQLHLYWISQSYRMLGSS